MNAEEAMTDYRKHHQERVHLKVKQNAFNKIDPIIKKMKSKKAKIGKTDCPVVQEVDEENLSL